MVLKKDKLCPNRPFLGFFQFAVFSKVKSRIGTKQVVLGDTTSVSCAVRAAGERIDAMGINLPRETLLVMAPALYDIFTHHTMLPLPLRLPAWP